jgi:DNA-binding Lrp family transcriptional regulator
LREATDAIVKNGDSENESPGRLAQPLKPRGRAGIDDSDRELIRLLQGDGRAPYKDLAKVLKWTERAVRKRVAELRDSGTIQISAVSDPRLLGYQSLALVGIRTNGRTSSLALAEQLFDIPQVDYAVTTGGRFDLLAEVLAVNDQELSRLIDSRIRQNPDIRSLEVMPYLQLHYQQPIWDLAQTKPDQVDASEPITMEEMDAKIIRLLNEDGRLSFLEMARQLAVSESQVRKRYSRLLSSGRLRVLAMTNPHSLGYETKAWLCITVSNQHAVQDLADAVSALPHVAYLAICAGRFDIMAEVICRDKTDLARLLDERVRALPGLDRVETLMCYEFLYRKINPL